MKHLISLLFITLTSLCTQAQNLVFEDEQLKALLISENCVNFDGDFSYEADVDTNDDFEISLEEALQVMDLRVTDSSSQYNITSVNDLEHFTNLHKLTMWGHDSLASFDNLELNELTYLQLNACQSMEHIDISNLEGITHLRIEDFSGLEYLNIQNGSLAAENFSLFYTQGIAYACVDSIAAEYNLVEFSMAPGNSPSIDCSPLALPENALDLTVYPNPCMDRLLISSNHIIDHITIRDGLGRIIKDEGYPKYGLDMSDLNPGFYIMEIHSGDSKSTLSIAKH